ncbi:MAG: hypothetical protein AB7P76_12775 [Candidatus Melainabacteria bacterium]
MTVHLSFLSPARKKLFQERDAHAALALVTPLLESGERHPVERTALVELTGLAYRALKQYGHAATLYAQHNLHYLAGYAWMLQGNMGEMQAHWRKVILEERPNHWCLTLYGMITGQLQSYPTLFQIRNFLESDLGQLIHAGQTTYMENILQYADFLAQLNLEAPKFMGRALLNAGLEDSRWLPRVEPLLMKGLQCIPNDPEVYYHLGQYWCEVKQPHEARLSLNQCLMICPTYIPARDLLTTLDAEAA